MKFKFLIAFFVLFSSKVNSELIEHSFLVQNDIPDSHSHHDSHINISPIHSSDTDQDEHDIFEIIEVPDHITELALKAKSYADAEMFAKKFNFKNLGRIENLPNTYNLIRDPLKNKKRKAGHHHEHETKPVFLNSQHKIYFLEDQVPLKRYKRDFLPREPLQYKRINRFNRVNERAVPFEQRAAFSNPAPTPPTNPAGFSPRQFFLPFNFFQQGPPQKPEIEFNKPIVFGHEGLSTIPNNNLKLKLPQHSAIQQAPINLPMNYDDELFKDQWYLNQDSIHSKNSLHVRDAWNMGYTGKGVVLTIIDDGIEWNHTDLIKNYDPAASIDINGGDSDPMPSYLDDNAHGTRCAGEIAMQAGNRKCGVGIAYNAKVGGIRLLDGNVVDIKEAQAFLHNYQHVDIYSSSWGPSDDGETVDGPKPLAREALARGVEHGRRGLGSIYVWASGNGGRKGDNCNCDAYVGSIYTIAFGSVGQEGAFPWYGERCSAMHAVTYSSNSLREKKIATTDVKNQCTIDHSGTSAAAPIAAGILALALEANPNLTWRDIQHLVTWTSDFAPMQSSPGWRKNAVDLLYNDRFGFGMLNAVEIIKKAKYWRTVPALHTCTVLTKRQFPVYIDEASVSAVSFDSNACRNTFKEVNFIEQVQVNADIRLPERGQLEVFLVSPSGTGSVLLTKRPNDASSSGFVKWNFTSVHFWGEPAVGDWRLFFKIQRGGYGGEVANAKLFIHGTAEKPHHMYEHPKRTYPEFKGDLNKVLDFTMPFDNELKNVVAQEVMHKNILSWSAMIDNTNRMKEKDEDYDFFDTNHQNGFKFPNPNNPQESRLGFSRTRTQVVG